MSSDLSRAAIASDEWHRIIEPLKALGERTAELVSVPEDSQLRYEMYRSIYSQISSAYFGLVYADPEYPDFWPYLNAAYNALGPNPDYIYYITPVHGDGVYRISGFRGTVRYVDFQIGGGTFLPKGTGALGPTYADYGIDELNCGPDGAFDVVLSKERPATHAGDWWPLHPEASYVMVRQIAYDWIQEIDARIAIERLDRPAIKPRPSAQKIERDLTQIGEWAENFTRAGCGWIAGLRSKGLVNRVIVRDISDVGGVSTQKYIEGIFDLEEDEALIVETDVPSEARYWNLQLTDMQWGAIDYINRQTSLNGHTAKLDGDGRFRAVICAQDPGVPNWLDTAGYRQGEILGRWNHCNSAPQPSVQKVKLSELRRFIPEETPYVTPAQRDADLRLRRKGAQLRRRW